MAWIGWFKFGNTNIVNNELSRGMAESASPAPFNWFTGPRFPTVQQALDPNLPYNQASIQQTPWYDPTIPESERFFGVYGLGVSGLVGSTRNVAVVESIEDGGVLGIPRKATKPLVYSVLLTARGRDALEYGFEWLDAVLDADACGMHGDICGVSDLQFYSDVPPARGTVDYYSDWLTTATNLLTNPSFETAGAPAVIRTNLCSNPGAEVAGTSTTLRTNLCVNPIPVSGGTGWSPTGTGAIYTTMSDGTPCYEYTGTGSATPYIFSAASPNAASNGDVYAMSAVVEIIGDPGATYSVRAHDSSTNTYFTSGQQTITAGGPQTVKLVSTLSAAVTAGNLNLSLVRNNGSGASGIKLRMGKVLIEKTSSNQAYFDGTTAASGDFTYAFSGTANASTSTQKAPSATSWTGISGTVWRTTSQHHSGVAAVACTTPGLSTAEGVAYFTSLTGMPGNPFSSGVWVWAPAGATLYMVTRTVGSISQDTPSTIFTGTGAWQWVSANNNVAQSDATSAQIQIRTATTAQAITFYVDDAILEQAYQVGPQFDGSTSPDSDLTAAWTGTVGASTSTLSAPTVVGCSAPITTNGFGFQSSKWSKSGSKSLRVMAGNASASNASFTDVYPFTVVPGATYTVMATGYLPAVQTGSGATSAFARSVCARFTQGSELIQGPQLSNAVGEQMLYFTFTVPAGRTTVNVRLAQGTNTVGDVYWDDVMLVEGTYTGPYFDGSNLPASSDINLTRVFWDGAVNGSTSEYQTREALTRPQTDDEWAATVNLMARYMHGVGTIAGPMVAQELESGPFNAYIVTFTLQATRPYIYSASTDLDLPPQIPIVYQDIPYNLAQYPSFELTDGTTPTVATNYVLNPSVETDATGWTGAAAVISGTSPAAFFTSGRVTGELSSVGNSSFRDRILGDGSTSVTNSKSTLTVQQTVDLSAIASSAGKRPSITVWAAATILAGASGSSIDALSASVQWQNSSGTVLRTDTLGSASAGTYNGHVFSQQSMVPPAGWSKAVVLVNCNVTWSSSSTPANNSDIRLYVDAMGVTIP